MVVEEDTQTPRGSRSRAGCPAPVDHITVGGDFTLRGVTIQQYFGDTRRADRDSRNRRAMIEKVWAIWITGVLQPSLPQDILLDLGLTEHPALVTRALDLLVQRPEPRRPTARTEHGSSTCSIAWIARCSSWARRGRARRRCCSTLSRDLLRRTAQDPEQLIPVVFPLSSWAARRRPLAVWLVDELQQRYDVPHTIGQAWVDADQVLPLLDGFDEVQPSTGRPVPTRSIRFGRTTACCP